MTNLLHTAITVATRTGWHTLPPSGTVCRVVETWASVDSDTDASGEGTGPHVVTVTPSGEPTIEGLPTEPGAYIVAAQVAAAIVEHGIDVADGVRLFTPGMLLMPGQDGHPGGMGPVAPHLVERWPLPRVREGSDPGWFGYDR